MTKRDLTGSGGMKEDSPQLSIPGAILGVALDGGFLSRQDNYKM